jgi:polar amino acid transport system permease protein
MAHAKNVTIDIGDGAAIPRKKDKGMFDAWWVSLFLCLGIAGVLLTVWGDTFRPILAFLADGIPVTFQVTIGGILGALFIGLFAGLGRISKVRIINLACSTYIEVVRGIPLLVQLMFIYFGLGALFMNLPQTNFLFVYLKNMPPMHAAITAMSICYGAYMGEVFRAGIESIEHGQTEAARSLGFTSGQTMRHIILPQAWRTILPPVGNEFIALLKDSSLVSILAVADILRRGREYVSVTFQSFESYAMVALVYLFITLILSKLVSIMEARLSHYVRD